MRIAVIGGAGGMGRVTTADAAKSEGVELVLLVDRDEGRAAEVAAAQGNVEVRAPGDGAAGILAALAGADAVVNAATHRLNVPVMRACLEIGAHYTDLGGLYYYAIEQYELDEAFRRAGLSAAISMGAAPGITNMLAAAAVAELDTVESIEVLDACVAGRPYDPDEPYVPAYAADTLIDEFTRPAPMFIDGREQLTAAGGGARTYHLPEGDVECVYTIHSEPATLPRSYAELGIRTVEWRLGLPPAHTLPLRALVASGMASTEPVRVSGHDVIPRDVLVAVLARQAGAPEDPGALERLRAHVVGTRGGERVEIDADLPLASSAEWGTDAGTYSTGVPPSIAAQLLAGGQAVRTGVGGPEVMLPVAPFFAALASRGMHAEIAVHRPLA
jgi:saccharopine dehydrogenase-like NADP-dependent oxidoreductase